MRRPTPPSDQESDGKPTAPSLHDAKRSTRMQPNHVLERIAEAIRHQSSRCRGLLRRAANCRPTIRAIAPPFTFPSGPPKEYVLSHHDPSMNLSIILPCDLREPRSSRIPSRVHAFSLLRNRKAYQPKRKPVRKPRMTHLSIHRRTSEREFCIHPN